MGERCLVLGGLTAFLVSLLGIYIYLKVGGIGIWREDINKPVKRKVLTGGGIPILIGLSIAYIAMSASCSQYLYVGIGIVLTTVITASFGLMDELVDIRVWKKVPLMLISPIPLTILGFFGLLWFGTTVFWINFGVLYWLLVVPVTFMGFSNGANIIAGYDGLEAGVYLLISLVYIAIGVLTGDELVLYLSIPLFLAIFAFELYNLPPSKVIMGNVGSFTIGGLLGIIPLVGHFEIVLPIVFLPHIVEFLFKIKYRGHTSVFGVVEENGVIHNKEGIKSIIHWLISWGDMTEKKITMAMLGIEAVLCVIAFLVWYLFYVFI